MNSSHGKITFIEYVTSNPYSKILTPISAVFGVSDVAKALLSGGGFPIVSVGVVSIIGAFLLYNFHHLRAANLKDRAASKEFYPFLGSMSTQDRARLVIARPDDLKLISDSVIRNSHVYSIISGESGAGKSILLAMYAATSTDEKLIRIVDNRVNSFYDLLTATLPFITTRDIATEQLTEDALAAISGKSLRKESISDHFSVLIEHLRTTSSAQQLVLVFEQSERLSANIRKFGREEFAAALALFEALRGTDWIRVAFVTRNDRATDVLTLLPRQSFDVIFINSLRPGTASVSAFDIQQKFLRLCSHEDCNKIIQIATQNNVHNTLILALAGYIVEATGPSVITDDPNSHGYNGTDHIISIYLKLLCDEYAYLRKDASAKADMEMALYAMALYNHRTNLGCTLSNVARISHLPEDHVEQVIAHLVKRDLIRPDESEHEYRLAHDLLSDHVLRREENEYLRIDHALSMQQIVDRSLTSNDLIEIKQEKDPFISTIIDGRPASVAAVLLWIVAVLYGLRLANPELVMQWLSPINATLDHYFPGLVDRRHVQIWYFLPIAFTQYVWVLFMYGLDRGFFHYVTIVEGRPIMRWIMHFAGPFGAALGFILSFTPALFMIPIIIPGLALAIAYLILWSKHDTGKLIGNIFLRLGGTTLGNMFIAAIVCAGLTELLLLRSASSREVVNFASLFLVCASFLYFAYAMRGLQGSLRGRAAMLTMYDSGRRR